MFDSLTQRFEGIFSALRGKGRLSEADVDAALREVRLALLEADVNVAVVRSFLRVRDRALRRLRASPASRSSRSSENW